MDVHKVYWKIPPSPPPRGCKGNVSADVFEGKQKQGKWAWKSKHRKQNGMHMGQVHTKTKILLRNKYQYIVGDGIK
jgi:hypothetical protein